MKALIWCSNQQIFAGISQWSAKHPRKSAEGNSSKDWGETGWWLLACLRYTYLHKDLATQENLFREDQYGDNLQ